MDGAVPELHFEARDANEVSAIRLLKVDRLDPMPQPRKSRPELDPVLGNLFHHGKVSFSWWMQQRRASCRTPSCPVHVDVGPQMNSPSVTYSCAHFRAASGVSASRRLKNSATNLSIGGGAFGGQIVSAVAWLIVVGVKRAPKCSNEKYIELVV